MILAHHMLMFFCIDKVLIQSQPKLVFLDVSFEFLILLLGAHFQAFGNNIFSTDNLQLSSGLTGYLPISCLLLNKHKKQETNITQLNVVLFFLLSLIFVLREEHSIIKGRVCKSYKGFLSWLVRQIYGSAISYRL